MHNLQSRAYLTPSYVGTIAHDRAEVNEASGPIGTSHQWYLPVETVCTRYLSTAVDEIGLWNASCQQLGRYRKASGEEDPKVRKSARKCAKVKSCFGLIATTIESRFTRRINAIAKWYRRKETARCITPRFRCPSHAGDA